MSERRGEGMSELEFEDVVEKSLHRPEVYSAALRAEARRARESEAELLEALKKIAECKGPFSSDRLTHAENTIEAMRELTRAAIAKAEGR